MRKKYIIAVSGGVDSVVLLHRLMSVKPGSIDYIVAHFDHGIREGSVEDARFVQALAKKFGAQYLSERAELGEGASEEAARKKRYEFLRRVKNQCKAEAIITAHHQDDVIETMIVNILRGTGPRGLVGYSAPDIVRPFLAKTKQEILDYAQEHNLEWREDETNSDTHYLRNDVRARIVPRLQEAHIQTLLDIRQHLIDVYAERDSLAKKLLVQLLHKGELQRPQFVVLPYAVQMEVMAAWLRLANITYDATMVRTATLAVKTAQPGVSIDINKHAQLLIKSRTIFLDVTPSGV